MFISGGVSFAQKELFTNKGFKKNYSEEFFVIIRPPLGLLPVLGPLEAVHDSYT